MVTTVGPPGGLAMSSVPSKALIRRSIPRNPLPAQASAPPRPSSSTVMQIIGGGVSAGNGTRPGLGRSAAARRGRLTARHVQPGHAGMPGLSFVAWTYRRKDASNGRDGQELRLRLPGGRGSVSLMAAKIVTCPRCGRKNRVPAAAKGSLRCGSCHSPLPWIVDAIDDDFAEIADGAAFPWLSTCGRLGACPAGPSVRRLSKSRRRWRVWSRWSKST